MNVHVPVIREFHDGLSRISCEYDVLGRRRVIIVQPGIAVIPLNDISPPPILPVHGERADLPAFQIDNVHLRKSQHQQRGKTGSLIDDGAVTDLRQAVFSGNRPEQIERPTDFVICGHDLIKHSVFIPYPHKETERIPIGIVVDGIRRDAVQLTDHRTFPFYGKRQVEFIHPSEHGIADIAAFSAVGGTQHPSDKRIESLSRTAPLDHIVSQP